MKQILTSPAPLARQLAIGADDTITNRAFTLSLERPAHILLPSKQPIDQRPIGKIDDPLCRDQPTTPLFLVDADPVGTFHSDLVERVGRRESDDDGHCLLIHVEAGGDFTGFREDFDGQRLVVDGLRGNP